MNLAKIISSALKSKAEELDKRSFHPLYGYLLGRGQTPGGEVTVHIRGVLNDFCFVGQDLTVRGNIPRGIDLRDTLNNLIFQYINNDSQVKAGEKPPSFDFLIFRCLSSKKNPTVSDLSLMTAAEELLKINPNEV